VTATGRRPTFNLADLLEIVVDTVPDREALVAGAARRTFGELDMRANRVANHCRTAIAGYKVPRELKVVDAIQRTPSGKADYRWAKQLFEIEPAAGS
jgi:3-oxocholest-4-en-26-oate---CoA ligase